VLFELSVLELRLAFNAVKGIVLEYLEGEPVHFRGLGVGYATIRALLGL